jgi:hypothetical protein
MCGRLPVRFYIIQAVTTHMNTEDTIVDGAAVVAEEVVVEAAPEVVAEPAVVAEEVAAEVTPAE